MIGLRWLAAREGDVPAGDAWLAPEEQCVQAGLRFEARRRDWRLGRWTAKKALGRCPGSPFAGLAPDALAILADADGAPAVTHRGEALPCSLSLSHRAGHGLAVVGPPEARLGCDLEIVEARSPEFVEDFFTAGERHRLGLAAPEDRDRLANLVWSAKESAVKALRTGLRVDTRTTDVHLLSWGEEEDWLPLRVRRGGAPPLEGWWRQDGLRLATVVSAPAPKRPERLISRIRPWPGQPARARSA